MTVRWLQLRRAVGSLVVASGGFAVGAAGMGAGLSALAAGPDAHGHPAPGASETAKQAHTAQAQWESGPHRVRTSAPRSTRAGVSAKALRVVARRPTRTRGSTRSATGSAGTGGHAGSPTGRTHLPTPVRRTTPGTGSTTPLRKAPPPVASSGS